jgi:hypothetical protein
MQSTAWVGIDLGNEERPGRQVDRAVKALPQRYTVRVLKKVLTERQTKMFDIQSFVTRLD